MADEMKRALEHGEATWGARFRKEGFAFTEEDDLAFALGWPHLVTLVADEDPPEEVARDLLFDRRVERAWPLEATHRAVRALRHGRKGPHPSPEAEEALATPRLLSEDEAIACLEQHLRARWTKWLMPLDASHAVEALAGPSAVLATWLRVLENETKSWLGRSMPLRNAILAVGDLLLRVPEAEAEAARERLQALVDAHLADHLPQKATIHGLRGLDVVLHGREGAERSGLHVDGAVRPLDLMHVHRDPGWVLEQALALRNDASSHVDARLAFLVGERWLEREREAWSTYRQPKPTSLAHGRVADQLGRIRSPIVTEILFDMAERSKAKKLAKAWFATHADFARPYVEAKAEEDAHAATAKRLLRTMR